MRSDLMQASVLALTVLGGIGVAAAQQPSPPPDPQQRSQQENWQHTDSSYAGFWVTRRSGGVICRQFDDLDAIFKFDTCDDLRQLICAFQPPPSLRCGPEQLEHHQLGSG